VSGINQFRDRTKNERQQRTLILTFSLREKELSLLLEEKDAKRQVRVRHLDTAFRGMVEPIINRASETSKILLLFRIISSIRSIRS
jgi:hypothetical protein